MDIDLIPAQTLSLAFMFVFFFCLPLSTTSVVKWFPIACKIFMIGSLYVLYQWGIPARHTNFFLSLFHESIPIHLFFSPFYLGILSLIPQYCTKCKQQQRQHLQSKKKKTVIHTTC